MISKRLLGGITAVALTLIAWLVFRHEPRQLQTSQLSVPEQGSDLSSPLRERSAAASPAVPPAAAKASDTGKGFKEIPPPDPVREPHFAAFNDWLGRYGQSTPDERARLEPEGRQLAQQRLTALADMIPTHPERALELAIPFAAREAMPASIRALLEEPLNARGDLAVIAALTDSPRHLVPPVMRQAKVDGQEYETFTYGKGLEFMTKADVPLNGVAVPNSAATQPYRTVFGEPTKLLALSESPARVLDRDEARALRERRVRAAEPEPICSVSQKPVSWQQEETVVEFGGELHAFCGKVDASWWANANIAASGLDLPAGKDASSPAKSSYTEGRKRMFCMRPYWSNYAPVLTTNEAITRYTSFSNYMWQMSYGQLVLAPLGKGSEISPDLLLPGMVADYDNTGLGKLYNTCRDVARTNYGYDLSRFDFLYVMTGSQPAADYCGLAFVGGVGFHIPCWGSDVTAHEFGHNLGLNHAHFWDTSQRSIIGAGQNVEYGDNNDPMGGGGNPNQFNARYKNYLGWITNADIATVSGTSSNRYRLYCFDLDFGSGLRGIQFARSGSQNYWINFRQRKTGSAALMNGVQLLWTGNGNQGSYLLDVRLKGNADNNAVVIGRTFSDTNLNFHFTPVGKGNTYPESIDVVAVSGVQAGNLPPVAFVSANTLTPNVGQAVTFGASASDPNGDALAYYWEFGDGADSYSADNRPVQTHAFASAGEYVVRCVVSDMRGGTAQQSLILRVGNPAVFRISGHVTDLSGRGLGGVLVRAGSRSAYVDSDGSYTIAGLAAGSYTVSAIEPVFGTLNLVHPSFNNPVSVGPDAEHIDFVVGTNAPQITLLATGATWRYFDLGTDPGAAWFTPGFSDVTWSNGPSQLGYGEDDESTEISYGGNTSSKHIAYYFRSSFNVANPSSLTNIVLNLLRDDGAIVYLNGTEIFRNNMPGGPVTYTNFASANASDDGETWFTTNVARSLFLAGANVLAAEVHQESRTSSDVTFNLFLTAESATNVVRGAIVYVDRPGDNSAFTSPTNISIMAYAFSTPAAVTNVDIYDGALKLSSLTAPPYSTVLNSPSNGLHTLRAVSIDNSGVRRTSAPVNITVSAPVPPPVALTLLQTGAVWRYFCTNVAAPAGWQNRGFNDSSWASGPARIGFNSGNTGLGTVLNGGPSGARYITAYFRRAFLAQDPASVTNLTLTLARDDGAVVYLNGVEILRDNIQNGIAVNYSTLATNAADNGSTYYTFNLPLGGLLVGTNIIAVEVHQSSATSSDLVFDLGLNSLGATNRGRGCWLASPSNGSTFPGFPLPNSSIALVPEAVAGGSLTVTAASFYANGTLIGSSFLWPFTFTWNSPPAGAHSLQAVVADSAGAAMTSAPVNITVSAPVAGDALISFGDVWKYLDDGSDPGTGWRAGAFNDNVWMMGPARLGYGGDGELTAVSYGTNANSKYITTYFRKKFVIGSPAAFSGLLLRLVRDDGAVVYLNGTEVFRTNLPAGPISYNSLASAAIGGADETTPLGVVLGTAGLVVGTNTIAVEMHQDSITSSDLGFDLSLTGLRNTNTADGIYITSPGRNAHYNLPATIALSAHAISSSNSVTLVEYYNGVTRVGLSSAFPYSANWNNAAAGDHILTAVATLTGGQKMTSPPVAIVVGPAPSPIAPIYTTFMNYGAQWRYWDNAAAPGEGWAGLGFDDSAWAIGNARFGWGLDGENTVLNSNRTTHYFRRTVMVNNGSALASLTFNVMRDDGIVVYLNGIEAFRTNMPVGPVNGSTLALASVSTPDETIPTVYTVPTDRIGLLAGSNVVAVELHQASVPSSDASFDLSLYGEGTTERRLYLAAPPNGAVLIAGPPLAVEAQAQAGTGRSVSAVEFYSNGILFGQATGAPYRFNWSGASTGMHTLVARMIDDLGNSMTSAPVQISLTDVVSLSLVPAGSVWKYLDDGSNQGTNWTLPAFDDSSWASGAAELGYGDLPDGRAEATVICCSNAVSKYLTYYFRHRFVVPPNTFMTNLTFRLVRDDGAVVYLNGREMYRSNMPPAPAIINYLTPASGAVSGTGEATFYATTLGVTNVFPGTNVVAVEIHQSDTGSSDVSFNLELTGSGYVFSAAPPSLSAVLANGQIRIAWPANSSGYQLYGSDDLGGAAWQLVGGSPTVTNGFKVMTLPATNAATFYRLQNP